MIQSHGYAAKDAKSPLAPFKFERRDPGPKDIAIDILYCGICHSDIHTVRNEWSEVMATVYPVVPGHEIIGRVTHVGKDVKKFKVGDIAGVGCMVDSDRTCPNCKAGEEQFCLSGADLHLQLARQNTGKPTYGGYSNNIVVDRRFRVDDIAKAGPCRDRAVALRRNYYLFAVEALEGRTESEGRYRWPWRARPHGAEVCPFVRRARGAVHDFAQQGSGGQAAWCRRGCSLQGPGRGKEAHGQLRLHSRHRLGEPRCPIAAVPAEARTAFWRWWARRRSRCRFRLSHCYSGERPSPGRSSAAFARPRKCWTIAPSTASFRISR